MEDVKKTILLVEDEAMIAMAEKMELEDYGYQVITSLSGKQAIALFKENKDIDLVLMDIDLGEGMDGAETAEVLLRLREIPVVFLSSHTEPEVVEKTEKITSYGYIVKNSNITVLDASIKMAFKLFRAKMVERARERELRASEEKYRLLFHNAMFGVATHKIVMGEKGYPVDYIFLAANPTFEEYTGLKVDEIIGKRVTEVIPGIEKSDFIKIYGNVCTSGEPINFEQYSPELKKHYHINAYKVAEGEFATIFSDITRKKEMEIALRESEEKYRLMYQNSQAALFRTKLGDAKILAINIRYAQMMGYKTIDECIADFDVVKTWVRPEERQVFMNQMLRDGYVKDYEAEITRKDGMRIWISFSATAYPNKGYFEGSIIDITEQKKALCDLVESEEKFRSLFDNINVAAAVHEIVVDESGKPVDFVFLDANEVYEQVTRLKKPDIIGKKGTQIIPSLEQKWIDLYGQVALTGEAVTEIDHSEYLDKYWEVKAYAPKIGQFAVLLADVTERIKASSELKAAKDFAENLLETANAVIVTLDNHAQITKFNKYAEELTGYKKSEVIGRNWFDIFIPKRDRKKIPVVFSHLLHEMPEYTQYENPILTKFGDERIINWSNNMIRDTNNEITGMLSIGVDVTANRIANTALKNSENRFKRMADNARDMIYRMSIPDGKYEYVSPASYDLFGYTPGEFYGQPWIIRKMIHEDFTVYFLKEWEKLLKGEISPTYEYAIIDKHGRIKWMNQRNVAIRNEEGEIIALEGIVTDITERKMAEQAMMESEEKYRLLAENSYDMVFRMNLATGEYTYISPASELILGYTPEEIMKEPWHIKNAIHPAWRDWLNERMSDLQHNRIDDYFEYQLIHKSGMEIWLGQYNTLIKDKGGNAVALIGRITDITKRKKAEEKQEMLALVLDQITDNILVTDLYGNLIYVNKTLLDTFGYSEQELIGEDIQIFNSKLEIGASQQEIYECTLKDGNWRGDIISITLAGEKLIFDLRTQLIKDKNGNPIYLSGFSTNINQRKRDEESIRREEEKFRYIADFNYDWEYWVDPDGNFIYMSPSCERITGYAVEEFIEKPHLFWDIMLSEDRKLMENHVHDVLDGGIVKPIEYRIKARDGKIHWIGHVCREIHDETGVNLGQRGSNRDITERKKVAEKVQHLLEEKELLLKEVHHRIKNNMSVIRSLLHLQSEALGIPEAAESFKMAITRLSSMEVLYDRLYKSDNYKKLSVRIYINALIGKIINIFPNRNKVKVETDIMDFKCGAKTLAPLGIIVNELISNSMKYAFEGRENGKVSIAIIKDDSNVTFTFMDNGIGASQAAIENKSKGFGMKLVKMLVQQIDGEMDLKVNRGTQYDIRFSI